jgi:hypothetical protein
MADFCKQCSIELFGRDRGDLRPCSDPDCTLCSTENRSEYVVICEGCGFTRVDGSGACLYHEANGGKGETCIKRKKNSFKELEKIFDSQ